MTETIALWEAPRSGGTSLSFALYNGLKSSGANTVYEDEPLHPRWLRHIEEHGGAVELEKYRREMLNPSLSGADIAVHKWMAAWIYEQENRDFVKRSEQSLLGFKNIVLIRDPREMLSSYRKAIKVHENIVGISPEEEDFAAEHLLGIKPLHRIFHNLLSQGDNTLIVDRNELLSNPAHNLSKLCDALNINFSPNMLEWNRVSIPSPPWGEHWYTALRESRGLEAYREKDVVLSDEDEALASRAQKLYKKLHSQRYKFE